MHLQPTLLASVRKPPGWATSDGQHCWSRLDVYKNQWQRLLTPPRGRETGFAGVRIIYLQIARFVAWYTHNSSFLAFVCGGRGVGFYFFFLLILRTVCDGSTRFCYNDWCSSTQSGTILMCQLGVDICGYFMMCDAQRTELFLVNWLCHTQQQKYVCIWDKFHKKTAFLNKS